MKNLNYFEENISNLRFVAFDTETTGIQARTEEIIEIAALVFDEDFEHRKFKSLIKPEKLIPKEVTQIHGITDESVKDAPGREIVLTQFFEFLSVSGTPRVMVAHNAGFDVGFLNSNAAKVKSLNNSFETEIVIDSCILAKMLLPELKTHKLSALANYFKIEVNTMHRADEDVRVLKEVFMKLLSIAADKISNKNLECTLMNLIDCCGGYFELAPWDSKIRSAPFKLSPRIQKIEELCGQNQKILISYETEENVRYITPKEIIIKGFRVMLKAFCHRDDIDKTFRVDKILSFKI